MTKPSQASASPPHLDPAPTRTVYPSLVELPGVRLFLDLAALSMVSVAVAATTSPFVAAVALITMMSARVVLCRTLFAR